MNIKDIIPSYKDNNCSLSNEIIHAIEDPLCRNELYKIIPNKPDEELRDLVLALFRAEMTYRDNMWRGEEDDENDLSQNIYLCALFLFNLGKAEDTHILWEAKQLNMDVGTMIDANYFVGAGITRTMEYLQGKGTEESAEILNYIKSFELTEGDIEEWLLGQYEYHDRDLTSK